MFCLIFFCFFIFVFVFIIIYIVLVLSLAFDRQTDIFGSVFGLFGVTTIVGITLLPCGSNEPVQKGREKKKTHLEIIQLMAGAHAHLPVSMSCSVLEFEFL